MYILTYVCHHFPKTIQIPTVSHMYNKFSQPNYSETLLLQSRLSSASSSPPSTSPIRESRYLPPHPVFPSPSPLANQGNHYSTLSQIHQTAPPNPTPLETQLKYYVLYKYTASNLVLWAPYRPFLKRIWSTKTRNIQRAWKGACHLKFTLIRCDPT